VDFDIYAVRLIWLLVSLANIGDDLYYEIGEPDPDIAGNKCVSELSAAQRDSIYNDAQ